MRSHWTQRRLAEVITIKHGFAFAGKYFSDSPTSDVLLTPGNFRIGGGFKSDKLKYYDGPVPSDYVLDPGSLVVTMTDLSKDVDALGYPAWSPDLRTRRILHNQRVGLVEPSTQDVDLRFLYYVMCGRDYRQEVIASSTGTTVHHTSPTRILNHRFHLPPLEEQRWIAATLGALDDKVESNRRVIDLAEQLGDALFASAISGKTALSDAATLVMGSSPPGSSYNEVGQGLPFYQGVRDFGRRYPRRRVWTTEPMRLAEKNDTLVSVRAPVGDLNRASEKCCLGRGVASLHSSHPGTVFYALRSAHDLWEPFQNEGTVFGAINKSDLAAAQVPWPSPADLELLEAKLSVLDSRIQSLDAESDRLLSLRDTLLPELLTGRIPVSTTSQVAQEAVE